MERYGRAVFHGIRDSSIEKLANATKTYLRLSEEALQKKDYTSFYVYGYAAWSHAVRLYERMRSMYVDFTNAVVFLMMLMAPFVILLEKLIGKAKGLRRLVTMLVISGISFAIFMILHPGFSMVYNISALGLGVILMVLSLPTIFFLVLNLSKSLGTVRRERIGAHFLERETFELFVAAMAIGVENMKKRALRTGLTLATIILIVMSLVSLTSVIPLPVLYKYGYKSASDLNAILIQSPSYEPLDPQIIPIIRGIVGEKALISVRYWIYPTGEEISVYFENGATTSFKAILGISPEELDLTFKDLKLNKEAFENPYSCLIPRSVAKVLGIEEGMTLTLNGYTLTVAGIIPDTEALNLVREIDETPGKPQFHGLLPLDLAKISDEQRFDKEYRITWNDVLIVNSKLLEKMPGAFIFSIEVGLPNATREEIEQKAFELYSVFTKLEIYANYKGDAFILSEKYVQEFFGFNFLIIPVIIAGLVLTMTILSNIQERTREMAIYSSLGLAPFHVAGMFLAENIAYAIIGSIFGYIGGIIMARVFNFALTTGGMIGMNYSSSSVMVSIGIVLGLVMMASAYPFLKVAQLVTPSLERKWKIPTKPKGNRWEIPLPFTFRERSFVIGLSAFLKEFLEAHKAERAGVFSVIEDSVEIVGDTATVRAIVWLAPFEQNIRQKVEIRFTLSKTEGRYLTLITIERISGPYDPWVTSNETFIRDIRKQLLTWRLLKPEDREKYIKMGLKYVKGE